MKLILIRHLPTKGNLQGRYIGSTDESLCMEEMNRQEIETQKRLLEIFTPERVICSPMKRTKETAALFFPGIKIVERYELREIDFGQFEGKNYEDLKTDPAYQGYIDSGGVSGFSDGETLKNFKMRCQKELAHILSESQEEELVFVVHGGTIMAIMEALTQRNYFDFQVPCGKGYIIEIDKESMNCTSRYSLIGMEDEKK